MAAYIQLSNHQILLLVGAMELTVRAYLLDEDDNILLVKHASDQMRVLPGGQFEEVDKCDPYACLQRELNEELGVDATIIGSESRLSDDHVAGLPLPVSIQRVKYEHRNKGEIERMEYWFFARAQQQLDEEQIDGEEIYDYRWVGSEELLLMKENVEIHQSIQEVYEQNEELLLLL